MNMPTNALIQRQLLPQHFILIVSSLAWFALSPTAQAQLSPPPDGGYGNANTAEGDFALYNLTSGHHNTAIGQGALFSNTAADGNTATGGDALTNNTTGSSNTASGADALRSNTDGFDNTADGVQAL